MKNPCGSQFWVEKKRFWKKNRILKNETHFQGVNAGIR